jgi:3,4-dihydroxy 2-butanone 4-phosphate synthase/GTP cyclohydrolase II
MISFNTPEELIADLRSGKMVVLVDDEDRENEGDLVLAADHVTPEAINFMAIQARGLICLALAPEQIERLKLPMMVREDQNDSPNKTAFTVSIEASSGVSTGISAADRAHTIWVASRPDSAAKDVRSPGHVFPIKSQPGGVLKRAGHTEGSVDLARMAGLNPAAVICEVMNEDGTMARVPHLRDFALKHGLKIGTIVDLIEYRLSRDQLVEVTHSEFLPEIFGGVTVKVFRSRLDGIEHLAIVKGAITSDPTLVRVQLDSYSRDLFSYLGSGTPTPYKALEKIQEDGGVFVLLRGNNRPKGLAEELKVLSGDSGHREMDNRDYGIGAQILRSLGVQRLRLLSNKKDRRVGLKAFGLEIDETVPVV